MVHPPVYWAQRSSEEEESKNVLLITIEATDLNPESYSLEFPDEGSRLVFKGKSKGFNGANVTEYEMDIELFDKVLPDQVKKSLTGKSLYVVLPKKELKQEYWPRLTKDKKKTPYIKTDFDKWVDEDEQDGEELEVPQEDPSSMMQGGGGGFPGGLMGGGGAGAGGLPAGFDMEALMKQMGGGAGGMPDFSSLGAGGDDDEDEEDASGLASGDKHGEDDMPPLENA